MRRVLLVPAALVAILLTGCESRPPQSEGADGGAPPCELSAGDRLGSAVLMAQAVPSAPLLPCARPLPAGWSQEPLKAHKGEAHFRLDSDRDGVGAADISLRRKCDVTGASEVPSERSGTRRFEKVTRVTPGYVGDRYYVFDGACITYHFNLRGTTRGAPLAAIAQSIGFLTRDNLRALVREKTDNRLSLDSDSR